MGTCHDGANASPTLRSFAVAWIPMSEFRPSLRSVRPALQRVAAGVLLVAMPLLGNASGVPEPPLVLFGVVTDALGKRLTNGAATLTLRPGGGAVPIPAAVNLSDIGGQYSYVVQVRTVTPTPALIPDPQALVLSRTPVTGSMSAALPPNTPLNLLPASRTNLVVSIATRGQLLRTDLSLGVDSDNNGLIDAWERLYFGRLGNSPTESAANDGISNLAKMYAGLDPRGAVTTLPDFTLAQALPNGSFLVEWASHAGRTYTLQRAPALEGPFTNIVSNLPATPPANRFTDAAAASLPAAFYRVQLNP